METKYSSFGKKLLRWHSEIDRKLPWKKDRDPYKIWLSEIIMQQTRVEQGTPYYMKFIDHFPTVIDLANADEVLVMKLWEGLGYYSRARNLHFTAKYIRDHYDGKFPDEYTQILALKGVGEYTAAAIASFAYGMSYPVVDGNVIRVISRFYGIEEAVDDGGVLKRIKLLAKELLSAHDPAAYNQTIMDFGALHCTPRNPICDNCPMSSECMALQKGLTSSIPFKSKKTKKTDRYFHYLIIRNKMGETLIRRRAGNDIWKGLYEFPLVIGKNERMIELPSLKNAIKHLGVKNIAASYGPEKSYKHVLSHQNIYALFYEVEADMEGSFADEYFRVDIKDLNDYPFPRLILKYLEDRAAGGRQLSLL